MKARSARPLRLITESDQGVITSRGRPKDRRKPIRWSSVLLRLLTIAWAAAIVVALLDEFGIVAHLPFILAMSMTGLLVGTAFVLTKDDSDDYAATPGRRKDDVEDDGVQDLLTELPTLNHFARRLNEEFARARRMGRELAIVLVDVNNLTAVNKEYGVRAGDEVLKHVATIIEGTRRINDVAARLGDDEFGILLLSTGDEGVHAFINRLEDRLARDSAVADVAGRSISLWAGVCTGSAVSDPAMSQPEALLESAMGSLNQAKQERERRRRMWLSA